MGPADSLALQTRQNVCGSLSCLKGVSCQCVQRDADANAMDEPTEGLGAISIGCGCSCRKKFSLMETEKQASRF